MGDYRASIKIEWSAMGFNHKADMWINYSPNTSECPDIDQRVIDFFREAWTKSYEKFHEEENKAAATAAKREREKSERAEYERLKAKFG